MKYKTSLVNTNITNLDISTLKKSESLWNEFKAVLVIYL